VDVVKAEEMSNEIEDLFGSAQCTEVAMEMEAQD